MDNTNGLCKAHSGLLERIVDSNRLFKWALILILAAMGTVGTVLYNKQEAFQHLLVNPKDGILIMMDKKLTQHLDGQQGH